MGFFSDLFGSATGEGSGNEQSAFQHDQNEADAAQNNGAALQSQFGNQYGNENAQAYNYGNQAATAYSDLAANPGYSASDAASIEGNPNAAFSYYNPNQLEGDTSAYQSSLAGAAQQGGQELQAAPDNETNWQGGVNSALQASGQQAVSGYGGNLNTAVGTEGQQLGQAVSGEGQGLGAAVDQYGGNLNSAVNPSNLTVTPAQQQEIVNEAAQTTSGQYQKMSQQAQIAANAQGNTSPAALAAIEENIGQQGAIQAGNAATTARVQAYQTALSAQQNLAGLQSQNATNLYGAQSGATEALAGTQTGAAEAQGNAEQAAAGSLYGAQSGTAQNLASTETGANENIAANQLNASGQEANLGYNAAQQGGAQQIATDTGLQSTGQTLATNADNAASARATTVANQTQTGENNLRNYYTGEQSTALNAGATAGQQQLGAYGTQTSGVNAANSNAGNVANSANQSSGGGGATGAISAGLGALASLADGGTITGDSSGYGMDSDDFGASGMGGDSTDYSVPPTPSATPTPASPVQNSTVSKYRNAVRGLAGIVSPQFTTPAQQPTAGAQQQQGAGGTLSNNLNSIGNSIGTLASKLADGGTHGSGTPALIAEHGPEVVITKFANGGTVQPSSMYRPQQAPQQNPMRGDGSSVPGNEPGGAQGQQGWQGNAANQMAAAPIGGAPGQQATVFTRPTNVNLGNNGASDTVVPLNPGPNAKVLPSQMGMAAQSSPYRQPQQPPQAAQQAQPQMPSRYRPATGPKGLVGPQQPMQPYQSNARQGQMVGA